MNIDHMDAIGELGEAYELLVTFQESINNSMEGDHPSAEPLSNWLQRYEGYSGMYVADPDHSQEEDKTHA